MLQQNLKMKESKLFYLLKNLSKTEFKQFKKAVISPLFNSNSKVIQLFDLIKHQYPKFDNSQKTREALFSKLFPELPYNDLRLRRSFSDLTKVVERFMVFLEVEKNEARKEQLLIEAYGHGNLFAYFDRKTAEFSKNIENQTILNTADHHHLVDLKKGLYFHPQHNKYNLKDNTLADLADHLDAYYILFKLEINLAMKNSSRILNKTYPKRFFEICEQAEAKELLHENPLFNLYLLANQILQTPTLELFETYEALLFRHLAQLRPNDQRGF